MSDGIGLLTYLSNWRRDLIKAMELQNEIVQSNCAKRDRIAADVDDLDKAIAALSPAPLDAGERSSCSQGAGEGLDTTLPEAEGRAEQDEEGFMSWSGGECPVDPFAHVECFTELGGRMKASACSFNWSKEWITDDAEDGPVAVAPVIAYRILAPAQTESGEGEIEIIGRAKGLLGNEIDMTARDVLAAANMGLISKDDQLYKAARAHYCDGVPAEDALREYGVKPARADEGNETPSDGEASNESSQSDRDTLRIADPSSLDSIGERAEEINGASFFDLSELPRLSREDVKREALETFGDGGERFCKRHGITHLIVDSEPAPPALVFGVEHEREDADA